MEATIEYNIKEGVYNKASCSLNVNGIFLFQFLLVYIQQWSLLFNKMRRALAHKIKYNSLSSG